MRYYLAKLKVATEERAVTEIYLVKAESVTDVEVQLYGNLANREFQITSVAETKILEVIEPMPAE